MHWEETGEIIHKAKDAENIGSGSVWKTCDKFVMNFSETRNGIQEIFFAVSDDLILWKRLDNRYRFSPDPKWYKTDHTGRWDGIWAVRNKDGSYTGFFTAVPKAGPMGIQESIGMAHSKDGIRWEALPPPLFCWNKWGRLRTWEVGAVEKIGNRWWMLMGGNESMLGCRGAAMLKRKEEIGMFVYSARNLQGPFHAEKNSWRFLTGPCDRFLMTYFARFYPTGKEILVNHHSIEPPEKGRLLVFAGAWMAPLKLAKLTKQGCLIPYYWKGNEALKGKEQDFSFENFEYWPEYALKCKIKKQTNFIELTQPNSSGVIISKKFFDLATGIIIEGTIVLHRIKKPWASGGIIVETECKKKSTVILLNTKGFVEIGDLLAALPEEPSLTRIIRYDLKPCNLIEQKKSIRFRIFLRQRFLEIYIEDILIQCYTMTEFPTGKIGWVVESGRVSFFNVCIWKMSLDR